MQLNLNFSFLQEMSGKHLPLQKDSISPISCLDFDINCHVCSPAEHRSHLPNAATQLVLISFCVIHSIPYLIITGILS